MYLFFSFYMPIFYVVIYGISVLGCLIIRTKTSFLTIAVLTAMIWAGNTPELWGSAQNMAVFELFCLSAMFFVFEGKFGTRLMFLTFLMIMTNVICLQMDIYTFIRQSIISLLFLAQCSITLKASYNTRQNREYRKELERGNFWAYGQSSIIHKEMVQ